MPKHGVIAQYKAGCRCDDCKKANRDWHREYRQQKARKSAGGTVSQLPGTAPAPDRGPNRDSNPAGEHETAVCAEIELLDVAARPGLVTTAIALARVLDDRGAIPQHASAAGKLVEVLEKLRGTTAQKESKLGTMRGRRSAVRAV